MLLTITWKVYCYVWQRIYANIQTHSKWCKAKDNNQKVEEITEKHQGIYIDRNTPGSGQQLSEKALHWIQALLWAENKFIQLLMGNWNSCTENDLPVVLSDLRSPRMLHMLEHQSLLWVLQCIYSTMNLDIIVKVTTHCDLICNDW
jgi:hypothetical protein